MADRPFLSVVVPAYNGTRVLPKALAALAASDLPREHWELIVVDDGSTDDTAALAAGVADAVVRLPGPPHGPAYGRNRGVEAALGDVLVFVDADVCVHPDTLRRFAELFSVERDLAAAFGSYDDRPPASGLISQYRNLLHHYHHQRNPGEAETFWAGCGAVRRSAFMDAGKFDEWHYNRPSVEDIELGHRLRAQGGRIALRPEIQCAHLKRWTLYSMLRTDLLDRGIPWMRLLLHEGRMGAMKSLNLKVQEKINTGLVGLALVAALLAVRFGPDWLIVAGVLLVPVLVTNFDLYRFFVRQRGLIFALGVLPLHLAYYVLNGCSAAFGWLLHHWFGELSPAAEVQAFHEVGVSRWPPVPARSPWGARGLARLTEHQGGGVP